MRPQFSRGFPRQTLSDADYAERRLSDRKYASKSFTLKVPGSRDNGTPARYIIRVFDDDREFDRDNPSLEWSEAILSESPKGRVQVKVQVAREAGRVRLVEIQKVTTRQGSPHIQPLATFLRTDAERLVELLSNLGSIPVDDAESIRLPDEVLEEFFRNPGATEGAYRQDPAKVRELVEQDVSAEDIAAIAHRKKVVEHFEKLLDSSTLFSQEVEKLGENAGPEKVWQTLFEHEPWLLGVGLSEQLLTSWDSAKLEQVVTGSSVTGPGKRVDALMKTNGVVRSLVFAEIKHHNTALLDEVKRPYRPACWALSKEISGGIIQIQQTVYHATREIGESLNSKDDVGNPTGDLSYVVRPRSYLVVGSLTQVETSEGMINEDKFRSFELYRRNLYEPIIVTFDELLARAKRLTDVASKQNR